MMHTSKKIMISIKKLRKKIIKWNDNDKPSTDKTDLCFKNINFEKAEINLFSIIDNTDAVIYLKDLSGKYFFVNRKYEQLFKLSKKDIENKTDYDIFPKIYADKLTENDKSIAESAKPVEFEEKVLHDDGDHFYISHKFPVFRNNGELFGICGISTDITLRKKLEKEKERVIENLQETLKKVKELNGLLPIYVQPSRNLKLCPCCKKIENENGDWTSIENYIKGYSNIKFTEEICPKCQKF